MHLNSNTTSRDEIIISRLALVQKWPVLWAIEQIPHTADVGLFTFPFCREHFASITEPDAAALNSSQQWVRSPAMSPPVRRDCWEALGCSLKLMKHQHTSLLPPLGHYAQAMSMLHRALQITTRKCPASSSSLKFLSPRHHNWCKAQAEPHLPWSLMVFCGSVRDYADKPTLRKK